MLKAFKQRTNAFFFSLEGLVGDTYCCNCTDRPDAGEITQFVPVDGQVWSSQAPAPEQPARPLSLPCKVQFGDYDAYTWTSPCASGLAGQVDVQDVQEVAIPAGAQWSALATSGAGDQPNRAESLPPVSGAGTPSSWSIGSSKTRVATSGAGDQPNRAESLPQVSGAGTPSSWSIGSSKTRERQEVVSVAGQEYGGHKHLKGFYSKKRLDDREAVKRELHEEKEESSGEERERKKELDSCKNGLRDVLRHEHAKLMHESADDDRQLEVERILEALGDPHPVGDRHSISMGSKLSSRRTQHVVKSKSSTSVPTVDSEATKKARLATSKSSGSVGSVSDLSTADESALDEELRARWEEEKARNANKIGKILSLDIPRENWKKREKKRLHARSQNNEPRQTCFEREQQRDIEAYQEAIAVRMALVGVVDGYTPKPAKDRAEAVVDSILQQYKQVRTSRELFEADDGSENGGGETTAGVKVDRHLKMTVDVLEDETGMKELPPSKGARQSRHSTVESS